MSEPKIVIGAGAAGLTAAAVCAERGGRVLLIEKMERPGRKLRITGKGRCNVTNATFDLQGLLEHIPTNPRFLYSAFSNFMPYDTIALMEDLGVPTKIERGERVFPVSDNGYCRRLGAPCQKCRCAVSVRHGRAAGADRGRSAGTGGALDRWSPLDLPQCCRMYRRV